MLEDILTIIWKDKKGLMTIQGSRSRALLTYLLPTFMIAVLLPIQQGREYLDTAWSLIGSLVVPLLLVGTTIPESFAGERERHTLPTLLASRLPDRAILLGKWGLCVAFGWTMSLVILFTSLLVVNVMNWEGRVLFFKPTVFLLNVVLSLLLSALMASLGVFISLRAEKVQTAQQTLVFIFLVPIMLLQAVPMVMLSVVPNGREILERFFQADFTLFIILAFSVLVLINAGLLWGAITRFQRSRLLSD
jgi:ABC-2 type transport system permease protein